MTSSEPCIVTRTRRRERRLQAGAICVVRQGPGLAGVTALRSLGVALSTQTPSRFRRLRWRRRAPRGD